MHPRRLLHLIAWLLAAGLSATGGRAASDARWLRVPAAEFTLVTQLSERQAVAWATEFSHFIVALKAFFPIDTRALPPLTVVIFARDRDFNAYRPLGSDGRPQEVIGFFSRRKSWAVAGLGAGNVDRIRTTIFHEGTHWFMSGFRGQNPVWLDEGIAELFSTFTMDKKNVSWGRAITPHVNALNALGPMPLEKLLFLAKSDLFQGDAEGAERTGLAYAQSWAFMHYLIFGETASTSRKALMDYLRLFGSGTHPDEAFTRAFGQTYREMDVKLAAYLRSGRYYTMSTAITPIPELRAEPATPAQVQEALARLALAARRFTVARDHALQAATPDAPAGHVLLGDVHLESGDRTQAEAAFQQAIANGSRDFRPHYELAATRHRAASGSLTAAEARQIANGYQRAINFNPRFLAAYHGLAGLIESLEPGNAEDGRFLAFGLQIFPNDAFIRLGLALIADREGRRDDARKGLADLLNAPTPPPARVRAYAQRLEATWAVRDLNERVKALEQEKKYTEAVGLLEETIAASGDANARRRMQTTLRNIQSARYTDAVRTATAARDWTEVRRLIAEILAANDVSPLLKTQMANRLKELDRRGLGKSE